jgi:hypothetical protein
MDWLFAKALLRSAELYHDKAQSKYSFAIAKKPSQLAR